MILDGDFYAKTIASFHEEGKVLEISQVFWLERTPEAERLRTPIIVLYAKDSDEPEGTWYYIYGSKEFRQFEDAIAIWESDGMPAGYAIDPFFYKERGSSARH